MHSVSTPTFLPSGRLKTTQTGLTLIEVLVSMFILAIGLLALLSVQLRSVSGVREAESQTIVAQISQNLIEDMLVNPTLSAQTQTGSDDTTGWTLKSYSSYYARSQTAAACTPQWSNNMTKAQLATAQICQFKNSLAQALPETTVYFSICKDNSETAATIDNGVFKDNCNNGGNTTFIKAAWVIDSEETPTGLNTSGNGVVYSFQARVSD